uniref:Uncharacterized protein n=1 Tax=Romanomermis culicivorax TaxID=13658 RepID=A0A915ISU7_ROMCU
MLNQRGTAQRPSATPSDEIRCLQSEMARLTAQVAQLTAQQTAPPARNRMPSMRPSARMCSYHGCCTHNDASCGAQHPDSAGPSNATANSASCCYFCQTRAHPTDRWDRPCLHC